MFGWKKKYNDLNKKVEQEKDEEYLCKLKETNRVLNDKLAEAEETIEYLEKDKTHVEVKKFKLEIETLKGEVEHYKQIAQLKVKDIESLATDKADAKVAESLKTLNNALLEKLSNTTVLRRE